MHLVIGGVEALAHALRDSLETNRGSMLRSLDLSDNDLTACQAASALIMYGGLERLNLWGNPLGIAGSFGVLAAANRQPNCQVQLSKWLTEEQICKPETGEKEFCETTNSCQGRKDVCGFTSML